MVDRPVAQKGTSKVFPLNVTRKSCPGEPSHFGEERPLLGVVPREELAKDQVPLPDHA